MGCSPSRRDLSSEEQILTELETGMEYAHNSIVYADMVLRKYSPHLEFNSFQLLAVASQLKLNLERKGAINFGKFYSKLKSSEGLISLSSLVLTAFLLCRGSTDEKARVLFELYDDHGTSMLDATRVDKMANELFDIACSSLPVITQDAQISSADRTALKLYVAKINYIKPQFVQRFASAFIKTGSRVGKHDFIEVYINEWPSKTTTSHGFRAVVFSEFASSSESNKLDFDQAFIKDNSLKSYSAV